MKKINLSVRLSAEFVLFHILMVLLLTFFLSKCTENKIYNNFLFLIV